MFFIPPKTWPDCFSVFKNHISKQVSIIWSSPKTKLLTENAIRFTKSNRKGAFTPWQSANKNEKFGDLKIILGEKPSSGNSENENTICKDGSFYDIVVLWQNHIEHHPLCFLNSIQFLTANMLELKRKNN